MPDTSGGSDRSDNDNTMGVRDDIIVDNVRMIVSALEYLKNETKKTQVREIEMAVDSALKICTATYSSLLDGNYSRRAKQHH